MTVTIAALELTGGNWDAAWDRTAHQRTYTYNALAEPRKLVDGMLEPLSDAELALLGIHGFDGELTATVVHDDAANGGSPSAADIGQEQLAQVSALYGALAQAWLGKTVTSEVG